MVDTLEAAVWCFLNSCSYRECVLLAVNLGSDTDTVAAVAGGLPGFITVVVVKAAFLMNGLHRFPGKTGSRGCGDKFEKLIFKTEKHSSFHSSYIQVVVVETGMQGNAGLITGLFIQFIQLLSTCF